MIRSTSFFLVTLGLASVASAAPLSGGARDLVTRLARAGNVSLAEINLSSSTATRSVARAFAAKKHCISEPTLLRLQGQPKNTGVHAMVFLELRCVTRVNGKALTPDLATALLRDLGYTLNGSDALITLLNNPPSTNALMQASTHPVTPLTPRN